MTSFIESITNFACYLTVIADIVAAVLFVILITPLKHRGGGRKIAEFIGENNILLAFYLTLIATIGSLFFSEIAQFQPCLLCWWQRIFLFPQLIILFVALISKKEDVRKYCLTLSTIGALISAYQTQLQFGGTSVINCDVSGVSCEHVYFLQYGYVTIPTMALTAFVLIILFFCFKKRS